MFFLFFPQSTTKNPASKANIRRLQGGEEAEQQGTQDLKCHGSDPWVFSCLVQPRLNVEEDGYREKSTVADKKVPSKAYSL